MSSLDQAVAEAKRLGMSYGQFKAMLFEKNGYKPALKEEPERENVRRCEICGIELLPGTRSTIKTCSGPCSLELNRRRNAAYYRATRKMPDSYTKKCAHCGSEFKTTKGNQAYCSAQCQMMRYRYAKKGTEGRSYGTAICEQCGTMYTKRSACQKWCSETCKRQAKRR